MLRGSRAPRLLRIPAGFALVALSALSLLASLYARDSFSRDDSRRLLEKVDVITRNGEKPTPSALVTSITEREVNGYLAYDGKVHLPAGLTEPRITVLPSGSLSGTAVVDLDAVRAHRKSSGMFDPLNYLSGKLPVAVTGRLQASNGTARFNLETANVGGVPVPKLVVQELVTYYSKSESNPSGISIDDPYPLPARIRQIDVRRGEALVRQ